MTGRAVAVLEMEPDELLWLARQLRAEVLAGMAGLDGMDEAAVSLAAKVARAARELQARVQAERGDGGVT